jgi:hypothetical protein
MSERSVINAQNHRNFKGSRVYVDNDDRKELPFLRPENESVSLWSVLKKVGV